MSGRALAIILGASALICGLVGWLVFRKRADSGAAETLTNAGNMVKIIPNAKAGFQNAKARYGLDYARQLEQMFRKETAHFTSGQWMGTGTPGMEARSSDFPFGWSSLGEWASAKGLKSTDFFLKQYTDNHDGRKPNFIGFKDTGLTVDFIAWFIKNERNGDVVSWYRLPVSPQAIAERAKYRAEMEKIKTEFV